MCIRDRYSPFSRLEKLILQLEVFKKTSKTKGEISIKEKENNDKNKFIEEIKKTEMYEDVKKIFSDANLIEVKSNFKDED